jgi:hypothetical protein
LLTYANGIAMLLASRMAFDAYGEADHVGLTAYFGAVLGAYALAGFLNFFLRRPFVSAAVFSTALATTIAFVCVDRFHEVQRAFDGPAVVDWRLVPAGVLILFALVVLAALALACSTRFDTVPTLSICTGFFLLGLVSDYVFGRPAAEGLWWGRLLYALTPNWQQFWLADALEGTKSIPWSYVGVAAGYMLAYTTAALGAAWWLFEDRELA